MDVLGRHESMLRIASEVQDTHGRNVMIYKGAFGRVPFSMIETYCQELVDQGPVVKKKVRSVFVELAQNINFYSSERDKGEGIGYMSIAQTDDGYSIISGNKSSVDNEKRLITRLEKISKLDNSGMHEYKRKLMHEGIPMSENANIGVVHSAIVAGSKFVYESVKTDDDNCFITLKIDIKVPVLV